VHTEYLQSVRYKLQKRIRRLKTADCEKYIYALRQFWGFFDKETTLGAIAAELARAPDAGALADAIFRDGFLPTDQKELISGPFGTEMEWAAVSMGVLRRIAGETDYRIVGKLLMGRPDGDLDVYYREFSDLYLTPFYEYIDERLDDPQFVLGRLIRFKHLCEWFRRDELFQISEDESRQGERQLTKRLYEFLYIEGLEIHMEPSSASGKADMVSSQEGSDRLVADSKIFNPAKGKSKSYILQGFRQIYQYTLDYNSAIGYLVIFNTSDKQLRFAVTGDAGPLPRVVLNHKTIFFLTIDVYPHEKTASKRSQQDYVEITQAEILGVTQAAFTT
jgi:hypothetical protein